MVVGRRRGRRGHEVRDVLEVAPDLAVQDLATAPLAALTAMDEELAPVDEDAPLKNARKTAAKRPTSLVADAAAGPARAFTKPPKKGVERAKVGYRRVRISSEPDAVRSVELGRLDRGDEVESPRLERRLPAHPDARRHHRLDPSPHHRGRAGDLDAARAGP